MLLSLSITLLQLCMLNRVNRLVTQSTSIILRSTRALGVDSSLMKRGAPAAEKGTKSKKAFRPYPDRATVESSQRKMIINKKEDVEILSNPETSENDKKNYRVIKLQNGLRALLISKHEDGTQDDASMNSDKLSDGGTSSSSGGSVTAGSDCESEGSNCDSEKTKGTHQSAASLTIGVGSFQDPEDIPGLAHFLEHMVFMGSEKFPQENDFDAFIKKQGGEDNASTDWDVTTFYFVSQTQGFKDALDRFAQFFISPLLKKEAMQREREAIESEFNLALPSDYHRKKQLITSLAKKGHPATKFSWGNVASLGGGGDGEQQEKKDSAVHSKLQKFREDYYVGKTMTLAVQSTDDLDTLQNWVVEYFSAVPSGNLTEKTPPVKDQSLELPFDTDEFRKIYYVAAVKDVKEVTLTWALPSMLDQYMEKPDRYLSWVLGYEGQGSLLQYLRERVWALELYAGSDDTGADHNSHYLHFGITVSLTDEGHKHIDEVLHAIFSYLKLMRNEGPIKRIFDELQKIQETKFRFSPEPSPGDNVESLSENMQKYQPEHYITGSDLFYKYNETAITNCLSQLRHDNVNIMILNNDNSTDYKLTEPWFNTPYNVAEVPRQWLSAWETALPLDSFTLPEPNRFLTTDFSISEPENIDIEYPEKIIDNKLGELWFKQDTKFLLPRAYIIFQLVSPIIFLSPENACMIDLMIGGLKQKLTTQVYPAEVADLSYSINPSQSGTGQGISMMVAGYNQNLPLLLETILQGWVKFEEEFGEELFNAVKDELKKGYYNSALKPSKLMKELNNIVLKNVHWSSIEKYDAIDDISFEQLKMYSKLLKKRLYCRMIVQGNMLKSQAVNVMNIVTETLKYKPLIANTWPQLRLAQFPLGETFLHVESVNKNSSNSAISQTFHCGLANMREICVAEVVMLMFEEASFDFLRTKEQLGYSVSSSVSIVKGLLRFSVTVNNQEDKNSITHVDGKIQEFLLKFYNDLKNLKVDELEDLKQSAMRQKLQADLQLREEVDRNWEEVYTNEHIFNRRQIEHNIIANITHEEMIVWFDKFVFDKSHKRILTLAVQGQVAGSNTTKTASSCNHEDMCLKFMKPIKVDRNFTFVEDIELFKSKLFFYPNHKILE